MGSSSWFFEDLFPRFNKVFKDKVEVYVEIVPSTAKPSFLVCEKLSQTFPRDISGKILATQTEYKIFYVQSLKDKGQHTDLIKDTLEKAGARVVSISYGNYEHKGVNLSAIEINFSKFE